MFEIKHIDSLLWPVKLSIPSDDGGAPEQAEFKVRFKYLPVPKFNEVLDKLAESNGEPLIKEFILGWDGLADKEGNTFGFSPENLDYIMTIPYILIGINRAFIDCQMGRSAKN